MTTWFNEEYYLQSKLAQLRANGETQYNNITQVALAIVGAGYTVQEHFEIYGSEERTSPNEFFNANEYLEAKARQLNAEPDSNFVWSAQDVADEIEASGLTIWGHFEAYGWKEGVNPSNSFDVSAYLADKLTQLQAAEPANGWTLDELKDTLETSGLSPVSHYLAYGVDEGIPVTPVPADERVPSDSTALTEALKAYAAAQDATANFLVEALENDLVAEAADADAKTATPKNIADAVEASVAAVDQKVPGFAGATGDNVREALIAGAIGQAQAKIDDAESALAAAQTAFNNAATPAEKQLAAQYQIKDAALRTAKEARDSAYADSEAAVAAFADGLEDGVELTPIDLESGVLELSITKEGVADPIVLARFQQFTDGSGGGRVVVTADGMGYEGLQAVVDQFNNALELNDAVNAARADRTDAQEKLLGEAGESHPYYQVIGAGEKLDLAESELDALEAAIADYREVVELNNQYKDIEQAELDARAAIEDAETGLGITLLDGKGVDSFTSNDDVYLFDEDDSGGAILAQFGAEGHDKIYFGEGFTLVALGDKNITDNVGDVNTLEIFWKEVEGDVMLWAETETFAGNAGNPDLLVEITLTGIGGSDFTDELGSGYLAAGIAA